MLATLALCSGLSISAFGATVTLTPGENVAAAVNSAPAGTTFVFTSGVYRMQSIAPKSGDIFVGEGSATLNGSQQLSFAKDSSSSLYVAHAAAVGVQAGNCGLGSPMCGYSEDLFINGQLQTMASSPSGLKAGSWYFDRSHGNVYVPVNPGGNTVELSEQQMAFYDTANGVQIKNLIIEKYATPAHVGTIGGSSHPTNWTISNVEVRWNHGSAMVLGAGSQVLNSFVHNNGQLGVSLSGANCKLMGTEISWNNYAGFLVTWEAGATKFWQTTNMLAQSNYVHDNYGKGLWADTDNIGTIYQYNTVVNNSDVGIQHEVSYSAIIRNNTVEGNIPIQTTWLGNSQIRVESSANVQVYDNTVEVPAAGGNGISVVQDSRGTGTHGAWVADNDYVHNNTITYLGSAGQSGMTNDQGGSSSLGSHFDYNHYIVKGGGVNHWAWFGHQDWQSLQAKGQETHGTCCN